MRLADGGLSPKKEYNKALSDMDGAIGGGGGTLKVFGSLPRLDNTPRYAYS